MDQGIRDQMTEAQRVLAKKLDAAGWGLFFIWIGIASLASLGWGAGLLGVGVIMLGGQLARKWRGLAVEGFGILIGALFFLGGVWRLLGIQLGKPVVSPGALVPALCIVAGALLLFSALQHRRPAGRTGR